MVSVEVHGVKYDQPTGLFINNEYVPATSGKKIDAINPATEEVIASVDAAGADDVNNAVKAARTAFEETWRYVTGVERSQLLRNLADEMKKDFDTLTAIEAADSGKPRWQNANLDVDHCVDVYTYFSGWADKIEGRVNMDDPKRVSFTRHQPFGVVAQIIPWNYPLAMASWKIGPAIAAGNTVVIKTAEQTPLSMLYFGNLVKRAGFPPGVINIISGLGSVAGAALSSHMDVDKIAFTGSTVTGQSIMASAAKSNLKACTLELGGKSPAVVFDDCDIEQAAKWCREGIMYNMGQVCCATSRVIVQSGIYDKFVEELKKVCSEAVIGDPFNKETTHGPQVSKVQFERVLNYIDVGKKEGAKCVLGGKKTGDKGFFIEPTIFADVKNDMRIAQEEIFGPVVVVIKFDTFEEGIKIANDTQYGLGGAVFTQNITTGHKAANEIRSGTVWVNSSNDQDLRVPFSGFKMSGIGSELGSYGVEAYVQPKTVQINLDYKL